MALILETRGGRRVPVLTAGNGHTVDVPMSWDQLEQLAGALADARTRYAA